MHDENEQRIDEALLKAAFSRPHAEDLAELRREITARIYRAIGRDSGIYPQVVSKIGSLYLHHPQMRPAIDDALEVTRGGRDAQGLAIANRGAYLVRSVQQACRQHGQPWSTARMARSQRTRDGNRSNRKQA